MAMPYVPKIAQRWVTVGVVLRPFGLHGEVRVRPETDFPERFVPGARLFWWLPPKPEPPEEEPLAPSKHRKRPPRTMQPQPCVIESVRWQGDRLIIKLEGFDTIAHAENLRGAWLLIPPEERMPLGEDEYYIDDLIGMEVFTETGERVGKLKRVIPGGAYDYYEIGKYTIPAVGEYILEVDVPRKRMVVRLPEI
ncbi:MAG: ribosome maturation factor RimM [Fimbriimonadales bacterium]|jgi:16S rRNA processing protein RimM|nr:ribosome maturation factor RimM [Fimbriimonadales bacterium]GBC91061.1 Ribosome maturation factor RimM [bacterium HR14]GIV11947.1 MAG: ribosome maturation factor RimM [Fimbriimonadales bacterium]CUU33731.1 16S rRNA processing protein RimM [Armatimonadetes bacterium GXS]